MSLALVAILVSIGLFLLGQTGVAVFWAGRHSERSAAHAQRLSTLEEKHDAARAAMEKRADESRIALREEVKSALESWNEGRGEKITELAGDFEKLTERIERGFDELRNMVGAISNEMGNQHHRIRAVERATNIQPSDPRFPAVKPSR